MEIGFTAKIASSRRRDQRGFCLDMELGSDAKQRGNETRLSRRIFLCHPQNNHLARNWRPLKGLVGVTGKDSTLPDSVRNFAMEPSRA